MTRGRLDFGRLREAIAGPGIDPRTWVTTGRVDNDPEALRWEPPFGWVADVTFTGGALDGDGPNPCRVASWLAGAGNSAAPPPLLGAEVLVVVPEGNPNANPVIVGAMHGGDGNEAPTSVNGDDIDTAYAAANLILVTDKGVDQQVGGKHRTVAAGDATLVGASVRLGAEGLSASDGVVQGTAIDPFTGLTYFVLGSASGKVFAKK